ncbi:PD-(D/E)XK nuclease family protein [Eupransor demetentiae]|uniref:ATP-dependent helicase/DNAse subunit B (AddB) n=1 Tax=Eupransor demetentiae TaxID=3109584 RepID=A0ABP0ENA2_9LACO|nr:ATP-dependent helicase/DNAse subunit B (AddB) [Lactobacillaceae bacterium LMG 33000]
MSVEILMGTARADFRQEMLSRIAEQSKANPNLTVFYVVPNHIKFDSEVEVLEAYRQLAGLPADALYAQSRLQAFSLSRLAWYLLKNSPRRQAQILDPTGLFMILSRILREEATRLPVFARMQAKRGFVQSLLAQLLELRASQITPEELLQSLDEQFDQNSQHAALENNLSQKLRDLAIVADAFDRALGDRWITAQESLPYLASQLADMELQDVAFYFEGFNGFTSAEWSVLTQLVQKYPVTISLLGEQDSLGQTVEGDLFYKPMETARRLQHLTQGQNLDFKLSSTSKVRAINPDMADLLASWEKLGQYGRLPEAEPLEQLDFFLADNAVTELQEVARRIHRDLVADSSLHLRDCLILARDLGPYKNHIPVVMEQNQLAYFLDDDVKMANHPIVELVTNLLKPKENLFYYQNILVIVKSGFLRPQSGEVDWADDQVFFDTLAYLDNYLTANQPSYRYWHDVKRPFDLFQLDIEDDEAQMATVAGQINQRLEGLRHFIVRALDDFVAAIAESKTMRQAAESLMTWLQKYQLDQTILKERNRLAAAGDLTRAQQIDEVWQMFIGTLDQLVLVAGEEAYDQQLFLETLLAGFSGASFSGIPNQLDQLTISEAGIVQSQHYRKLYFIGASRQNLPANIKNKAIINDAERTILQPALAQGEQAKYLQDTAQQQMASENLLFYGALAASSESVTLSYPLLDSKGQVNEMSAYLQRLVAHYQAPVERIAGHPEDSQQLVEKYLSAPAATLAQLAKLPNGNRQGQAFESLANLLKESGWTRALNRILAAGHYRNRVEKLEANLAAQLFTQPLNVSISQLEAYYRNPYEYFLRYGLRLQERLTHELNSAQLGTLYHGIMEAVIGQSIQTNTDLRQLDQSQLEKMVEDALALQAASPEFANLLDSAQGQATLAYVDNVALRLLGQMQRSSQTNQSQPSQVEKTFGFPNQSLPALKYPFKQSYIALRGKLDCFDFQDPNHQFGTILDYKSNGKKFDWGQAYDGLQMQLLTYWQAAQTNAGQLGINQVGGALFAKIAPSPIALSDYKGDLNDLLAGKVTSPEFKYHGLLLAENDYLDNLERVAPGENASYYPFAVKKDGDLTSRSETLTPDELDLLLARNQDNVERAAQGITAGDFPIHPVESSLQYSPYRDVMRFDRALGDQYQGVTPNQKQVIIDRLAEQKGGQDG